MTRSNADAKLESGANGAQTTQDSLDASLCENICTLRKKTTSGLVFLTKSIALITASIGWTILLIILPLLPLTGLIIGAIHKSDCPADERIPIWLIVWSSVLIMRKVIALGCKQCDEATRDNIWAKAAIWIVDVFIIIWFFCGSAWIFPIYKPEYEGDESTENYCHPLIYIFCFVLQILVYVILIITLICVFAIGLVCTSACVGAAEVAETISKTVAEADTDNK